MTCWFIWKPAARIFRIPGSSAYPNKKGKLFGKPSLRDAQNSEVNCRVTRKLPAPLQGFVPVGRESEGGKRKEESRERKENWWYRVGVKTDSKLKPTR